MKKTLLSLGMMMLWAASPLTAQNMVKVLDVHGNDGSIISVPISQIDHLAVREADTTIVKEPDFNAGVLTSALNPKVTSETTTTNIQEALEDVMYDLETDWGVSGTMLTVMRTLASTDRYTKTTAFRTFSYTYESLAADGTPITLSAQLAYPFDPTLDEDAEENHPTNVALYNHFTITDDVQCPSNMTNRFSFQNTLAAMWANSNRRSLVIMPDYEGYGVSAQKSHPFVQQPALARQGLDALRAGLQLYEELGLPSLAEGWGTITYGGSQGGGQAVAVHRLIEENGLSSELNFKGSISSGGPYDPLIVLQALMQRETSSYPALYPLTIVGLFENSPYLEGYEVDALFTDEMKEMGLVDIIKAKTYSTTDLMRKMIAYDKANDGALGYDSIARDFKTNKIIRQEIIDYFSGKKVASDVVQLAQRVEKAIAASNNRLEKGWTPTTAHTLLLHSAQDTYVAYPNFIETEREWVGNNNAHFIHYDGEMLKHHNTLTALSLIGLARLEADILIKGRAKYMPFDYHLNDPNELMQFISNIMNKFSSSED